MNNRDVSVRASVFAAKRPRFCARGAEKLARLIDQLTRMKDLRLELGAGSLPERYVTPHVLFGAWRILIGN